MAFNRVTSRLSFKRQQSSFSAHNRRRSKGPITPSPAAVFSGGSFDHIIDAADFEGARVADEGGTTQRSDSEAGWGRSNSGSFGKLVRSTSKTIRGFQTRMSAKFESSSSKESNGLNNDTEVNKNSIQNRREHGLTRTFSMPSGENTGMARAFGFSSGLAAHC